jgi:hypothetical protein
MSTTTVCDAVVTPRFSGHQSFTVRYGWLKKAVDALAQDRTIFNRDDALVVLGVGKNMVRSIRFWSISTGILEERSEPESRTKQLQLTSIGKFLFGPQGRDPYLEEPGTLWLLHWQLCSNPNCPTTWHWAFNFFPDVEFTKERLGKSLQGLVDANGWTRVAPSTLRRDVDCFVRSYVASRNVKAEVLEDTLDCPLVELQLIQEVEAGYVYAFARDDHPSLPSWVVAFALAQFWESRSPNRDTMNFDDVAYRPGSPGQVFKLSEDGLTRHLEALESITDRALGYDMTAGLRQVYRRKQIDSNSILAANLRRRKRRVEK